MLIKPADAKEPQLEVAQRPEGPTLLMNVVTQPQALVLGGFTDDGGRSTSVISCLHRCHSRLRAGGGQEPRPPTIARAHHDLLIVLG